MTIAAPEKCPAVKKAVHYYAGRIAYWRSKMGAGSQRPRASVHPVACPRYLAKVLRAKSLAARRAYLRWYEYHYHWQAWLPAKWQRIGRCETGHTWGMSFPAGNFRWESSSPSRNGLRYVSAFGIRQDYRRGVESSGYSIFAHEIGQLSWDETRLRLGRLPTPREQYEVAARIAYHFGYGAWGCGGA